MQNTDPVNGQLLQPYSECDAARVLQVDQRMEKLLSRIRSEAVYELRKLQQQHKPVSAFASKLDLEELRHRAPPPESAFEPAEGNPYDRRVQQLLSASDPQGYMPPAVRLEIRGLIERQQVSELLNSAHAGDIERVLQEGIERRHRRQLTPRQVHPLSDQAQPGGSRRGRLLEEVQRQGERALPRSQPENGQYRMPRRDQSSIVHQLQESPALNSLQPAERDRVLSEVNHLVQQHLVTSALSGEFRGVLELHIQNRADQVRSGVTGEDISRSLQRRSDRRASTARPFDPEVPSSAAISEIQQELRDMKSEFWN